MTRFESARVYWLKTICTGALVLASSGFARHAVAQETTVADAEAQAAMLQAQLEALQAQIDLLKEKAAKAEKQIGYKGSPEISGDGWKFKMRGRFQYDAGITTNPDKTKFINAAGKDFGFNSRVRRVRLGADGTLGGGFGFVVDVDFANAAVGFGDVFLTWKPGNGPFDITIGNQETLNSLEQMSSDHFTSFNERSGFSEAFYSGRRLGVAASYVIPDTLLVSAGAFNDSIQAALGNDDYLLGARVAYATKIGETQLQIGASTQVRHLQRDTQSNNYRARPLTQEVATRLVATSGATAFLNASGSAAATTAQIGASGTSSIAASGDTTFSFEAMAIHGPFHAVAEAQFLKVDALPLTQVLVNGDAATGAARLPGKPSFWGAYAEVGYFFTGETRGYKNFKWDRTKVLNPVSKGGYGALQAIIRYDRLDLTDTVGSGPGAVLVNGGVQTAYQVGLQWMPIDYVRFYLNYAHVDVKGGPFATTALPVSPLAISERSYGTDVIQSRVAFDF
jgi:phosphate-selective porin OprO and OprP